MRLDDSNRQAIERIAYRMLGSWSDAEDIAQETLVRWHQLDDSEQRSIREPLAWLNKVATRLCLDLLKSARRQRETYVGPWLPEPILTDDSSPATLAEKEDSIQLALMLALDRLTPPERAAFLLHDVFGYEFDLIAETLEKSPAACRKLASRARSAIRAERSRCDFDPATHQRLIAAFLEAIEQGDTDSLAHILAEDVILHSDGGGVVRAARKILETRDIVTRMFLGLANKFRKANLPPTTFQFHNINGTPTVLIIRNGVLDTVMSVSISQGQITAIFQQRNPQKLRTLARSLDLQTIS